VQKLQAKVENDASVEFSLPGAKFIDKVAKTSPRDEASPPRLFGALPLGRAVI
jgi:hypothetical protein